MSDEFSDLVKRYYDRQLLKRIPAARTLIPKGRYRKPTWRERLWYLVRNRRWVKRIYVPPPTVEWKMMEWRRYEP